MVFRRLVNGHSAQCNGRAGFLWRGSGDWLVSLPACDPGIARQVGDYNGTGLFRFSYLAYIRLGLVVDRPKGDELRGTRGHLGYPDCRHGLVAHLAPALGAS